MGPAAEQSYSLGMPPTPAFGPPGRPALSRAARVASSGDCRDQVIPYPLDQRFRRPCWSGAEGFRSWSFELNVSFVRFWTED
jgi:hypothetical protein